MVREYVCVCFGMSKQGVRLGKRTASYLGVPRLFLFLLPIQYSCLPMDFLRQLLEYLGRGRVGTGYRVKGGLVYLYLPTYDSAPTLPTPFSFPFLSLPLVP